MLEYDACGLFYMHDNSGALQDMKCLVGINISYPKHWTKSTYMAYSYLRILETSIMKNTTLMR